MGEYRKTISMSIEFDYIYKFNSEGEWFYEGKDKNRNVGEKIS